jgi:hypothetical protein
LPDDKKSDITNFKLGYYSLFKETVKWQILSFHGYKRDGELAQILFKSEERRKQLELDLGEPLSADSELFSIMETKDEVLHLEIPQAYAKAI